MRFTHSPAFQIQLAHLCLLHPEVPSELQLNAVWMDFEVSGDTLNFRLLDVPGRLQIITAMQDRDPHWNRGTCTMTLQNDEGGLEWNFSFRVRDNQVELELA